MGIQQVDIRCLVYLKILNQLVQVSFIIIQPVIELIIFFRSGQCKSFLVKIGSIIFSDYRLIERFTKACQGDITTFNCGRLDQDEEREHKQGSTIECLSQHVRDLSPECHLETLRVAEQQADDYHLDRPLFFACRDDRERFCRNIQAGQGRVYKCLMKNKLQNDMSNPVSSCFILNDSVFREQNLTKTFLFTVSRTVDSQAKAHL